jgi:hypothetical protein
MNTVKPKVELYRELVPLAEATAVAYHIVTERPVPLKDPNALDEVRGLVAVALSTVAPILKRENGAAAPLNSPEVNQRLFVRGGTADLENLYIRRVDLLRAVEVLKEAHVAFDRQHVIESLRED